MLVNDTTSENWKTISHIQTMDFFFEINKYIYPIFSLFSKLWKEISKILFFLLFSLLNLPVQQFATKKKPLMWMNDRGWLIKVNHTFLIYPWKLGQPYPMYIYRSKFNFLLFKAWISSKLVWKPLYYWQKSCSNLPS
jgi:hypothetical protein